MTSPAQRRVFLHIGAPKTGTTYLQDRLEANARELASHGVHVPTKSAFSDSSLFHFRAALDLLGQDWGGPPGHAEGAWDTLVRRVRRRTGTIVVSHEVLAAARPEAVARAKRDLGGRDTELHVVYTVRDLGRQLPAAWQESIKQGRRWPYRRFLRRFVHGRTWFSKAFDLPVVLGRWGAGLPPERVHVITVPSRHTAAPGDDLWGRFCGVVGIDPAWAPTEASRTNRSLGSAETQVLRRLNQRLNRAVRRDPVYDALIREMLAEEVLSCRSSQPVLVPPRLHGWVEEQAERWVDWIEASGVHVVGDLAELRPVWPEPAGPWVNPDNTRPRDQLEAALDALAAMTREAARRTDPDQPLVRRLRTRAVRLGRD